MVWFHEHYGTDDNSYVYFEGWYVAYLLNRRDVHPASHWAVPGTLDINS